MYGSSVKKHILALIAIFCIWIIVLVIMSIYRGASWKKINYNLLIISKGNIGNIETLDTSRDANELSGDIHYTRSFFSGALQAYEEAFLHSPTTRLGEKIRYLKKNTTEKNTATTSGESDIEEARTRIQEDTKRRDEYLTDGKEFRDIEAVFDSSLSETIDW